MKKFLFAALLLVASQTFAAVSPTDKGPVSVNDKVLKSFRETFEAVTDVSWTEMANGYEAHFTFNNLTTRVLYDKEGTVVQTIRYYYGQQLPLNLLTKVKRDFADQKVHCVTEVTTGPDVQYHIVLEDEKTWTMVLADNGGSMSVEKRLIKA